MVWSVRDDGGPPPLYDHCLAHFTIKMHHGGRLEGSNYVDGSFGFIDYCDEDEIGIIELSNMAIDLGITYSNDYYLRSNGYFTLIKSDVDALRMCQLVGSRRVVDVYAVCNIVDVLLTQCSRVGRW
ncbi:hypothetical protein RHMOL_Rhmol02G0282000 [Rhododendron molle]|uniref:Uncharacterized protein n=2 Tax=Rhododendron molle TaxID=49168 RepID=A0ACC0PXG6_RHOML|nr:hypothetical protein RHMOL_Rhmol02G0282000 [Rhododendron molle]KAI8569474.1 hypothetical protein RHMOL_Rhmol02G0282000 [Rhododendron molle]